jgi:small-conductance mechanosensitive channel
MAILIAPWLGLLFGLGFAWFAREDLAHSDRGPLATPALLLTTAFGLLILGPATGYFLAYAPDWSVAYLLDTQRLPPAVEMVALLFVTASPTLGFVISARAASRREGGPLLRGAAALVVVLAAVTIGLSRRFATDASFTQYHGNFSTRSIAGSNLGLSLLWMNAIVWASAGWVLRQLRRLSEKTRSPRA